LKAEERGKVKEKRFLVFFPLSSFLFPLFPYPKKEVG
jgi:hypothetical protein